LLPKIKYSLSEAQCAPKKIRDVGITPNQFGFVLSAALFGLMLGAFALGSIADRYGRRGVPANFSPMIPEPTTAERRKAVPSICILA
jgi:MFS family permease